MNCEHLRPELGAYVLGGLDPDEAAAVKRHLESCPQCAAEYAALAQLPDLLSLAGGAEAAAAEPLSPAFEERLLDAYARDRSVSPRRRRPWRALRPRWLAIGAAALVTATAAVAGIAVIGDDEPAQRRYELSFRNVSAPATARASANLESKEQGTTLHLLVRGLPAKDAVYEVLCDAESWTATAGTFRTDAEGKAYVILHTALRKSEYNAIRIVRRGHRADGTPYKRNVLTARLS